MISFETMLAYTAACLLVIASPGPDNLLVIARGISQGRMAALVSSLGTSAGILVHVIAATFGLAVLLQTSTLAFAVIKVTGALYLIWLGINAFRSKDMVSFEAAAKRTYGQIFAKGFLTNVLNPKVAIFILAFVPQFIAIETGAVAMQSLLLGSWFALLTMLLFSGLGLFSTLFATWMKNRPNVVSGLNYGAGATFIVAGLSVALLDRES